MSQRTSGYERKSIHSTPNWVTEVLIPHIPDNVETIWESACGEGLMYETLINNNYKVIATDITTGVDFFKSSTRNDCQAIITNPEFSIAPKFIEHALKLMRESNTIEFVAMLLKIDFDSAKSRRHIFAQCPEFMGKIVLLSRIVWFEPAVASPSENHCWMLWKKGNTEAPKIFYGP